MSARKIITLALCCFSVSAACDDYATCILDKMPGVENDAIAYATNKVCTDKYPGGFMWVERGSGRGVFSFDSGAECAVKKGSKTRSLVAGQMIFSACRVLYDKPQPQ